MHDDLFQFLKDDATIAALFDGRVYHMSLPVSVQTYPALTFQQITQNEEAPDFEAPNDEKMDSVLYQFNVIAEGSAAAISASDTLNTYLRNFRGTMGATKIQSVEMQNITHNEDRSGDKLRRRVTLDLTFTFDV